MAAPRSDSATVGWWDFDESSQSTAYDKSSLANNLTLTAGGTGVNTSAYQMWDLSDKKYGPSALEFDGDDYVTRADDPDFDFTATDNFSVEDWFKHNTMSTAQNIINKYSTTTGTGWKIWMDTDGDIGFGIDNDAIWTPTDQALTVNKNYDDNSWHHFVATKTETSRLDLYIDGLKVASDDSITATATLENANPLYIGVDSTGNSGFWDDAYLDNIKIYRQALTDLDVKTAYKNSSNSLGYQAGADPSTSLEANQVGNPPVAYWSFDEGSETAVQDRSGKNNTGAWNGTGTHWDRVGKKCLAGKFNGTNDYVDAGTGLKNVSFPLTMEAWVYCNDFDSTFPVFASEVDVSYYGFWIGITTAREVWISYGDGGSGQYHRRSKNSSVQISAKSWNHIVGIIRGATDMSIYINGREAGGSYSGTGGDMAHNASLHINIGRYYISTVDICRWID